MNNQEILEIINEKWSLGIDIKNVNSILRFQKGDKQIKGYSLNILEGLKIKGTININNEHDIKLIYEVIYSTLYLCLTKCLLEFNELKDRIIAVGHKKDGKPVLFVSDDNLYNDQNLEKYYGSFEKYIKNNHYNEHNLDFPDIDEIPSRHFIRQHNYKIIDKKYYEEIPFVKRFFDYFYKTFNEYLKIPYLSHQAHDLNYFYGFLEFLPVTISKLFMSWTAYPYYQNIINSTTTNETTSISKTSLRNSEGGAVFYRNINNDGNQLDRILNEKAIYYKEYEQFEGTNLVFSSLFEPELEKNDFIFDYLLSESKIIFINGFDIHRYYKHNLEFITSLLLDTNSAYLLAFKEFYNDIENIFNNNIKQILKIDEIINLFELTDKIEKNKYWVIKDNCSCRHERYFEFCPKGLICLTDNINIKSYLDYKAFDGNINLNICGTNKNIKIPYKYIEPFNNSNNEIDINKNKLLWADRDRIFYKDTGRFDYFVNENDEIVDRWFYIDSFINFFKVFIFNYINFDYSKLMENIKNYFKYMELTKLRLNDEIYTKIVNKLNSKLEINELVDYICEFIQYWDIKFSLENYAEAKLYSSSNYINLNNLIDNNPDAITEKIIKNLSFSKEIKNEDLDYLEKCFKIFYLNAFINENDKEKASKIRNLKSLFLNDKQLSPFEKRKIIDEFRKLIGLQNYENRLNANVSDILKKLSSYNLYSLLNKNKDTLFLEIKKEIIKLVEFILQYPSYENKSDLSSNIDKSILFKFLNKLFNKASNRRLNPNNENKSDLLSDIEKCTSFNSLKSYIKDISTLLPDVLKKRWNEVINKIIIIDSIDFGNFDHNIANFLINIFYELDDTKVYPREELEKVWKKCNFELEDYTNEAYSFDLTIENMIKAGLLSNNGDSYSVNV